MGMLAKCSLLVNTNVLPAHFIWDERCKQGLKYKKLSHYEIQSLTWNSSDIVDCFRNFSFLEGYHISAEKCMWQLRCVFDSNMIISACVDLLSSAEQTAFSSANVEGISLTYYLLLKPIKMYYYLNSLLCVQAILESHVNQEHILNDCPH